MPDWMVRAVLNWLDEQSPDAVRQYAESNTDVAVMMMGRYSPLALKFARGYIGAEGIEQLRVAGSTEWNDLINVLAYQRPAMGSVILTYDLWFRQQLGRARDLFLYGQ